LDAPQLPVAPQVYPRGRLVQARAFVRARGDLPVGVAPHEASPLVEVLEPLDRLPREGPPSHVAAEHDEVGSRRVHLVQHRVERGQIAVNIVEGGDAHAMEPKALRRGVL
jgi:hypothetical protein